MLRSDSVRLWLTLDVMVRLAYAVSMDLLSQVKGGCGWVFGDMCAAILSLNGLLTVWRMLLSWTGWGVTVRGGVGLNGQS